MRLKYSVVQQYRAVFNFWQSSCGYKGRCCDPASKAYKDECDELWSAWHKAGGKGKYPVMPPPTVECEKCAFADLTVGSYQGNASLRTISRHAEGTVPVPVKGRKKVWLDNVNQKQLDGILDEIDPNIEAFAITGSPTVNDFDFLERFSALKCVYIWWNTRAVRLWDISKTPDLEFLQLDAVNRIADVSPLKNAEKLRYFGVYGGGSVIEGLKQLNNHPSLEYISLLQRVADTDLRPLINIPNLKYLDCLFNLFDIDAYAMFEAERPDVDTNFWEGLSDYEFDKPVSGYSVGLVGKRHGIAEIRDVAKQEKHKKKYLSVKQKYTE